MSNRKSRHLAGLLSGTIPTHLAGMSAASGQAFATTANVKATAGHNSFATASLLIDDAGNNIVTDADVTLTVV